MSRVDYCNDVFAGSPRYITDKVQRVLNAAARLVIVTHKFDHGLSHLLHEEFHWLDVPERTYYKLGVTEHRWPASVALLVASQYALPGYSDRRVWARGPGWPDHCVRL